MKLTQFTLATLTFLMATSVFAAPKKAAGPSPEVLAQGKESFTKNCVLCHGDKGDGMGPAGAVMNPKPRNFATEKFKAGEKFDQVMKTITSGLPNTSMVGFSQLPEDERKALAYYVLTFRQKK